MLIDETKRETEPNESASQRASAPNCHRQGGREVAAFLERHREEIAQAWAGLVQQLPDCHYCDQPVEELCASTRRGLGAVVEALGTGSYAAVDAYLSDITLTRFQMGFDIGEVTEALMLCKEAVSLVIRRVYSPSSPELWEMSPLLDACLRKVVGHFAELYSAENSRLLHQQQARTATMLRIAQAASSSLELDEVLALVVKTMSSTFGMRFHCIVAMVAEEQEFITFRRAAVSDASTQETASALGYFDRTIPFAALDGFSLEVLQRRRPLTTYDAENDPRIPADRVRQWGSKSWLGLPILANEQVVALAWLTTTDDYYAFSQEEIDLAQGIANIVALAIDNAWLHQRVKEQAIIEERHRLAQEMHDNLSQMLGTVNWRAATADRLLSQGQIDQAQASLRELKDIAKQGYVDVRDTIFTLRSSASLESEFLPALERYLAECRTHHGLNAELVVDAPSFPHLPTEVRLQIIRIIQEALANVRQHAGASKVQVRFRKVNDGLELGIEDNGRGFDLAAVEGQDRQHFGLSILRERAASVGGELEIYSRPGEGTRVLLRLPVRGGEV